MTNKSQDLNIKVQENEVLISINENENYINNIGCYPEQKSMRPPSKDEQHLINNGRLTQHCIDGRDEKFIYTSTLSVLRHKIAGNYPPGRISFTDKIRNVLRKLF